MHCQLRLGHFTDLPTPRCNEAPLCPWANRDRVPQVRSIRVRGARAAGGPAARPLNTARPSCGTNARGCRTLCRAGRTWGDWKPPGIAAGASRRTLSLLLLASAPRAAVPLASAAWTAPCSARAMFERSVVTRVPVCRLQLRTAGFARQASHGSLRTSIRHVHRHAKTQIGSKRRRC